MENNPIPWNTMKLSWNPWKPANKHENPWRSAEKTIETHKKTMKSHKTTLKKHENQPKPTNYHEHNDILAWKPWKQTKTTKNAETFLKKTMETIEKNMKLPSKTMKTNQNMEPIQNHVKLVQKAQRQQWLTF